MAIELNATTSLTTDHLDLDRTQVAETTPPTGTPPAGDAKTTTIALETGNIVHLPAGADIAHPVQNGADLEFVQPDGSVIVIPGGAVAGLVVFVGDVEIPPDTLAAVFSANNIQPAEGTQANQAQGAHGNFTHEPGGIGNAFGIGGLLGPTELTFGTTGQEERFEPGVTNGTPSVGTNAAVLMDDDALLGGNPLGLDDGPDAVNTTGTLSFDYGSDGTGSVLLTGVTLPAGLGFTSLLSPDGRILTIAQNGTDVLRVTLTDTTGGNYTVEQLHAIDHPTPGTSEENLDFSILYTVTDGNGDTAAGTMGLTVNDDTPLASIGFVEGASVVLDESVGERATGSSGTADSNDTSDDDVSGNPFSALYGTPFGLKSGVSLVTTAGSSVGADQAGATTHVTLSITGGNGTNSGLTTTANDEIDLFQEANGDVTGRVGGSTGTVVFAIRIDDSGDVTVAQYGSLHNPTSPDDYDEPVSLSADVLQAVVTVTDGDDDVASDSVAIGSAIKFEDDGPAIMATTVPATLQVDETPGSQVGDSDVSGGLSQSAGLDVSTLFNAAVYGADGSGGTTYALTKSSGTSFGTSSGTGTATGLYATTSPSTQIYLFQNGSTVEGRIGNDPTGSLVFSISLTGTTATLTQYLAIAHPTTTDPNDLKSLLDTLYVTATAKDGDNDTATAQHALQLSFYDDGPSGILPELSVLINSVGKTVTAKLDIDGNVDDNFGADGGKVAFAASLNGTDSSLTSGGLHILWSVSTDGKTLIGFIDLSGNGTYEPASDQAVLRVTLNTDGTVNSASDTYKVEMFGAIDGGSSSVDFASNQYSHVGGNTAWYGFVDSTASHFDLLVTPITTVNSNYASSDTINLNNNNFGVGNGVTVDTGEGVRFDFVNTLAGSPPQGSYGTAVNQSETFVSHNTTDGASLKFAVGGSPTSESTVRLIAYDDLTADTSPVGGSVVRTEGTVDSITMIAINYSGHTGYILASSVALNTPTTVTVSGHAFNVTFLQDPSGHTYAQVGDILDGTSIATYTADGYNALEAYYVDGSNAARGDGGKGGTGDHNFAFQGVGSTSVTVGQPVNLALPVTVTDGDGDAAGGTLNVFLLPGSPVTQDHSGDTLGATFNATAAQPDILGSSHDDVLSGDASANALAGGAGDDTLIGGAGKDTLIGGAGTDVFKWGSEPLSGTNADTIRDYENNERIDITALMGVVGATAKVMTSGGDLVVRVNTGAGYVTAFTLKDAVAHNITSVNLYYGAADHSITTFPTGSDPIILDLDHNGYTFSSLQNGVSFDINGDGAEDKIAWNTSGDGMLAVDLDHNGTIDSGKELFTPDFNGGHFASGSEALASLDSNHDGIIDANDAAFSSLLIWKDANADGITQAGELSTLAENGIASLTAPAAPADSAIDGQAVTAEGTVTHVDGSTSGYVEVALDTALGTPAPLLGVSSPASFADGIDWDNVVIGTPDQADTLQGTSGADKFTLTDLNAVDFIADYHAGEGDTVDLSALLGGGKTGVTADNVSDYVRYDGNSLQVDTDGTGQHFVDVAILNQPVADVKVIVDDGVDATVNHIVNGTGG